MEEAIEQMTQDAEFLYSSRIVVTLLYNVMGDPLNDKYRRLRAGSKVKINFIQNIHVVENADWLTGPSTRC